MNTLELSKLKSFLLQEIEELDELNKPEPEDAYSFDEEKTTVTKLGYGKYYRYVYENAKKDEMEVTNLVEKPKPSTANRSVIYIAFGLHGESDDIKYDKLTGARDMIKVLATVVEATKQTIAQEGGEDNIYAIAFQPSDERRKNVYDHYIATLFPEFEKDLRTSSSSFTMYINKKFINKKINEIGDASAKPYETEVAIYDDHQRVYTFETDLNNYYEIDLNEIEPDDPFHDKDGIVLDINFGLTDGITGHKDMHNLTNKGELYRIMATVVETVKKDLAEHQYIKTLRFSPSSRDGKDTDDNNSRANIYKRFIKTAYPNAIISTDEGGMVKVKLK